jgi:hypothetical protein
MGFEDIIYDLLKEFRSSKADKKEKKDIARQLVKKVLLQFNFEWDSFRKSGKKGNWRLTADSMLEQYADLFIDVAVEVNEAVAEEDINDLRNLATELRKIANTLDIAGIGEQYRSNGDECAKKALELYKKF